MPYRLTSKWRYGFTVLDLGTDGRDLSASNHNLFNYMGGAPVAGVSEQIIDSME
jgi:hypothetical protein